MIAAVSVLETFALFGCTERGTRSADAHTPASEVHQDALSPSPLAGEWTGLVPAEEGDLPLRIVLFQNGRIERYEAAADGKAWQSTPADTGEWKATAIPRNDGRMLDGMISSMGLLSGVMLADSLLETTSGTFLRGAKPPNAVVDASPIRDAYSDKNCVGLRSPGVKANDAFMNDGFNRCMDLRRVTLHALQEWKPDLFEVKP